MALLSSSPSARAAFLTTYSAHRTLAFSDPLLAPAGSITGLSRVLNLLAFEHLFKEHVELADVKWDEGTRVLTVDAKTTWALPGVGLLRLQSEGVTRVFFEGAPEAEAGAGKDKGGERLVVGRLEAGESTDVNLAALLPGVVCVPPPLAVLSQLALTPSPLLFLTARTRSPSFSCSSSPRSPRPSRTSPASRLPCTRRLPAGRLAPSQPSSTRSTRSRSPSRSAPSLSWPSSTPAPASGQTRSESAASSSTLRASFRPPSLHSPTLALP